MLITIMGLIPSRVIFKKWEIMYLLVLTVYCLGTLQFTNGTFSSVVSLIWTILWIPLMDNCGFDKKSIKVIAATCITMFVVLIVQSRNAYGEWLAGKARNSILNPNTIGFLLAYFSSLIIIFITGKKKKGILVLQILLTYYGIINAESRGALIMFSAFLAFKYFLPSRFRRSKRVVTGVYLAVVLAGILFPLLYVYLAKTGFRMNFAIITNKKFFTGREWIWMMIFDQISEAKFGWLLGAGSLSIVTDEGAMINTHNAYMSVLMRFGLIGMALYYGYFILRLKRIMNNRDISNVQLDTVFLCISFSTIGLVETIALGHAFLILMSFLWSLSMTGIMEKKAYVQYEYGKKIDRINYSHTCVQQKTHSKPALQIPR